MRSVWARGRRHRADRPDPAGRAVAALARVRRHERQPGRQDIAQLDPGRRVRAEVAHGDREGDRVTDVRRRVADRLGDRQIGLAQSDRRATTVREVDTGLLARERLTRCRPERVPAVVEARKRGLDDQLPALGPIRGTRRRRWRTAGPIA